MNDTESSQNASHGRERVAWSILLAAFGVFLILCGVSVYSVQFFLFRSASDLLVTVTASTGTIGILLPNTDQPIAVTDRYDRLERDVSLQTDSNSQGNINFVDKRTGEVIASVTLFRDSKLELIEFVGPRFSFTDLDYEIVVKQSEGHAEVLLFHPHAENHSIEFRLETPLADLSTSEDGHYIVTVTAPSTEVVARAGQAIVWDRITQEEEQVASNERILVMEDRDPEKDDAEYSLVLNNNFSRDFTADWLFYNDREPPGRASQAVFQGRNVVIIDRSQQRFADVVLDHGETGLVQPVNLDVSKLAHLELRTTFFVQEQSLSTCGILGSECPMMVRFVYTNENDETLEYIQGFYATHQPELSFPLACLTCRSDHQRINAQSWYTYESGNLLDRLVGESRPIEILQVSFYASGHAYKVYISEFDLLASSMKQ